MRNGLGLSGNQLERYQTQRSIVIKKQADLVNCSALGSLAIEKGFETTVDKLLKELLKKAAGAVGGALGGAAAISGGIVIGMLLSTEEVGESKEELDEFVKEQEEKKKQENNKNKPNNKKDEEPEAELNVGKWNKGSFENATKSLLKHFKKHGEEVGAKDVQQYLRKAEEFARNLKGARKVHNIRGETSNVTRYYKNGKYIDLAPDGTIISFGKQ